MSLAYLWLWLVTPGAILYLKVPAQLMLSPFLRGIVLAFFNSTNNTRMLYSLLVFAYTSHLNIIYFSRQWLKITPLSKFSTDTNELWMIRTIEVVRLQMSMKFVPAIQVHFWQLKVWQVKSKLLKVNQIRLCSFWIFWTLCVGYCNMDCSCNTFFVSFIQIPRVHLYFIYDTDDLTPLTVGDTLWFADNYTPFCIFILLVLILNTPKLSNILLFDNHCSFWYPAWCCDVNGIFSKLIFIKIKNLTTPKKNT